MEYQGPMTRRMKAEALRKLEEHLRWLRHEALREEDEEEEE